MAVGFGSRMFRKLKRHQQIYRGFDYPLEQSTPLITEHRPICFPVDIIAARHAAYMN